jgi:hypothetical protein
MNYFDLALSLADSHGRFRVASVTAKDCRHGIILRKLKSIVASSLGTLTLSTEGLSLEGRAIERVTFGSGPRTVLLWSQMHGDEPTATLALLDIFRLLASRREEPWVRELSSRITMYAIPMLNPDGAERFRRYTAADIDMNRDAVALRTPEAQLLRRAQQMLKPIFGFNLHDQPLSSVGFESKPAAMSLLAPALDYERHVPPVRIRAMKLGAVVAEVVQHFASGHIATYDDSYEPRAFGDGMQSWGTSTLLIESGQWPGDPEKEFIRKLNFVGILSALWAIADGSLEHVKVDPYTSLVRNGKRMFDLLVRGLTLRSGDGWRARVDVGLLVVPRPPATTEITSADSQFIVKEIGDLSPFGGLDVVDASMRTVESEQLRVDMVMTKGELLGLLGRLAPEA